MGSVNNVVLYGRLTRDPEMRYTQGGVAVCDVGLAVNYVRGKGEEKKEEVSFVDCTCFGKTAENAANYLKKGRSVIIEGRLQQDRWEKDGQKHSKLKVVAERVTFTDKAEQPAQDQQDIEA
jgi:single-strand DNA-binding protein